jgi:hypothetical protein
MMRVETVRVQLFAVSDKDHVEIAGTFGDFAGTAMPVSQGIGGQIMQLLPHAPLEQGEAKTTPKQPG